MRINAMGNFGTYGRVSRPGNPEGWVKPDRAERVSGSYDYVDTMERGENSTAYRTRDLRSKLANHLRSKGVDYTPKNPRIKGSGDYWRRAYAPRGGDLEPTTRFNDAPSEMGRINNILLRGGVSQRGLR